MDRRSELRNDTLNAFVSNATVEFAGRKREEDFMTVGFIGVGAMGLVMAKHMSDAGFEVIAYDLNEAALAEAEQMEIRITNSIQYLVHECDIFFIMVATDKQTEQVVNALLEGKLRPSVQLL